MLILICELGEMSSTYSSHSLGDSSSNSHCGASTGLIASTTTRLIAGTTGGSGSLNESDGLGLGAVDGGGASVGSVLSRLSGRGIRARLSLYQS